MDILEEAKEYAGSLLASNAGGHDMGHVMRVYGNAMRIAKEEKDCDKEVVALAALLHDVDDYKLFDTLDNANARSFLLPRVGHKKTEQILHVINAVSYSQNKGNKPDTLEGKIVQDADRLDAMGAIGIARTFAYGGEHARSLASSIQHFHDKLLLLKDALNTDVAKKMAEQRHAFLLLFLEEYERETQES